MEEGYCLCGCGSKTRVIKRNDASRGLIAGEYMRYIFGHARRKSVAPLCGYVVDENTGCWNWMLGKDQKGYGFSSIGGKKVPAHVREWSKVNGPTDPEMELDHLCKNTGCVNPQHLEQVTPIENKRRSRSTKLNQSQVLEIKKSKSSNLEMALKHGVDPSNISHIRRGFSWVDVV